MQTKNAKKLAATLNSPVLKTVKKGQVAKVAAQVVRPAIPKGQMGAATSATPAKQGLKPSNYYPQGSAFITLLPLPANAGNRQQVNHGAIAAALGSNKGTLPNALANGATRRNVRQLYRAGYLTYSGAK